MPDRRRFLAGVLAFASKASFAVLSDAIDRIRPSLVPVGIHRPTDNPSFTFRGTGFAVHDGSLIATNAHVIASGTDLPPGSHHAVLVRGNEGAPSVRRATVMLTDSDYDLALLRLDGPPLTALPLADSSKVREGQSVAFSGFPIGGVLGYSPVTHRGIVSSITPITMPGANARQLSERQVRRLRAGAFTVFQLDATAYPGHSGSPVFDPDSGEIVAVVNMVLVRGTRETALSQPTGIAYAIPVNALVDLLRAAR
jgi:S1-C subfamily serine protease